MKKVNVKLLSVVLILTSMIFVRCQKDETQPSILSVNGNSESIKLKSLVDRFTSSIGSELKSSEIMSVDSANWYIEATLNYLYCRSEVYENYVVDTVKCVISGSDNNGVEMSNVRMAYNDILRGISIKYYSMLEKNRELDVVDIESKVMADGTVEVVGCYRIGVNSDNTLHKSVGAAAAQIEFGPTDYWKPYGLMGKCGAYEGQCVGRDATTELTRLGRRLYTDVLPRNGVYVPTWTNITTISGAEGLWGKDPNSQDCIDPESMNRYLKIALRNILDSTRPNGYYCNTLKVLDMHMTHVCCRCHEAYFTYGKVEYKPRTEIITIPSIGGIPSDL